jgi:hypothetical protein
MTSSSSSNLDNNIISYCRVSKNELLLKQEYNQKHKVFKTAEKEIKQKLTEFLHERNTTCVPINININNNTKQLYLRLVPKTTTMK